MALLLLYVVDRGSVHRQGGGQISVAILKQRYELTEVLDFLEFIET